MPKGKFTHGCYSKNKRLYSVWAGMKARCEKEYCHDYLRYGGSGVSVSSEWEDVEKFFLWAFSSGYKDGLTIDRVDSNLGYSPENCRWSTQKENNRNRKSNKIIDFNGRSMTMIEWSELLGISYQALKARLINGWGVEKALTTPIRIKVIKC